MLLFLDFDGVLRRRQAQLYRFEAVLLERLIGVLREYPEVEVVITSSWTDAYPMAQIKNLFPSDIAARIVGKTARALVNDNHARYSEVLVYMRGVAESKPWVALDDDPLTFPEQAPVILVNPKEGLDSNGVESLRQHFERARNPRKEN